MAGKIEDAEKKMEKLKAESDEALALYEKNEADLSAAIYGVREATKVLTSTLYFYGGIKCPL